MTHRLRSTGVDGRAIRYENISDSLESESYKRDLKRVGVCLRKRDNDDRALKINHLKETHEIEIEH